MPLFDHQFRVRRRRRSYGLFSLKRAHGVGVGYSVEIDCPAHGCAGAFSLRRYYVTTRRGADPAFPRESLANAV